MLYDGIPISVFMDGFMKHLKTDEYRASLAVLSAGVLWGTSCLFVRKMSALGMTSSMQTAFKMILTGAFYWIFLLATDRKKLKIRLRDCWIFAGAGIFSMSVFTFLHYYTLIHGQASVTIALIYTSPVFVMLLSAMIFGERISREKFIAVILAVLGCALTAGIFSDEYRTPAVIALMSIFAGFAYSTYSIFAKVATGKYAPVTMTAYTFLFAAICTIPFGHLPEAVHLMAKEPFLIALCLGKSLLTSAIPFFLFTWGISKIEAGKAAVFAAMDPLVSCIFGIIVFGEAANPSKLAGIFCILLSVIILNFYKSQQ